jgi:predicted site-specific integrase-resolvase
MKYKISKYAKMQDVTPRTVWRWIKDGKLNIERTETNRVLVVIDEKEEIKQKKVAIYARVSSSENKENLEKQKQRLLDYSAAKGYTVVNIITEVGSGLNDSRPKLEKLITDKNIDIIIVEHKDRFARFGINYIEKLLEMQGRSIEVINLQSNDRDDLMQDFVSIITSFTARLYGLRRNKRKTEQIIKQLSEE